MAEKIAGLCAESDSDFVLLKRIALEATDAVSDLELQ